MMKKLFLVLAMVASACAWAESEVLSEVVDGVTWYYETWQDWDYAAQKYVTYARITSGADKYTGDLVVPSTLGGYKVKEIGGYALENCSSLTEVTIPNSVTSIGSGAFYGCSSLTSVTMPEGVTYISDYTFRGCSSLESVRIPEGVTSIGRYAFYGCSSLTSVTIPEGVTSIGSSAFFGCSSQTEVTIPNSVTSIGSGAFSGCSSLASVTMPEGVTSIGSSAFYNCSSLERFDVPASVTSMGERVIRGCDSLTEITVAEGNVNYKCVNNCIVSSSGTTLVAVPFGCVEVDIPEGVTEIPECMFERDAALEYITIPGSVKVIGNYAFRNCDALMIVEMAEGVASIGLEAFCSCDLLESADLPNSITSIGVSAFSYCISLKSMVIPSGVKDFGSYAFYGCSSLSYLVLRPGLACVGDAAFYDCRALVSVVIPDSVATIGNHVFFGCSSLKEVSIPYGIKSIGDSVFSGCRELSLVEIPPSVSSIGNYAFSDCDALTAMEIPESVASIGNYALAWCDSLVSVTIPASVKTIGSNAFCDCYSLRDVTLLGAPPSGVENSYLLSRQNISYPREYGAAWMAVINDVNKFRGYNRKQPEVTVVSSRIRADDPTVLDVVYKVTSSQPTVKVRALAFEDGVRSLANVVRPETFVADTNGVATAGNVGDAIMPNVEHTLSWRVASDWSNRLAKVTFEVLASEGDLLPLEVRTIPASEQYGKMDVTWNAITESQWYDALMWLYADKNKKVKITEGKYFYDGKIVANGTTMYYNKSAGSYYSRTYDSTAKQYVYVYYKNVQEVVYGEMGYSVLTGDVLNYANDETRLGLSPSGFRQYGYKIVSEK